MKGREHDMKKTIKRILLAGLALALCVSLCSCAQLDEMRNDQATWNTDGTIRFRDANYKMLPENIGEIRLNERMMRNSGVITAPDVPVLLSEEMGDWMDYSDDTVFLSAYPNDYAGTLFFPNDGRFDADSMRIFCREDRYEEITERIVNARLDHYFWINYSAPNEAKLTEQCVLLDDSLTAVIHSILEGLPDPNPDLDNGYTTLWETRLLSCDKDLLFQGREEIGLFLSRDGDFVLLSETEIYPVPPEYFSLFAEFKVQEEALLYGEADGFAVEEM